MRLFKFDTFHTFPQILSMKYNFFVYFVRERKNQLTWRHRNFSFFIFFVNPPKKNPRIFFYRLRKTFFFLERIFAPFVSFLIKKLYGKTKNKLFLFDVRRSNGLTYLITQHFFLSCLPLRRFSSIKFSFFN